MARGSSMCTIGPSRPSGTAVEILTTDQQRVVIPWAAAEQCEVLMGLFGSSSPPAPGADSAHSVVRVRAGSVSGIPAHRGRRGAQRVRRSWHGRRPPPDGSVLGGWIAFVHCRGETQRAVKQ